MLDVDASSRASDTATGFLAQEEVVAVSPLNEGRIYSPASLPNTADKLKAYASMTLSAGPTRQGFNSLKENGQVVMRSWTGLFERVEGDRSVCHGCNGSGELKHAGRKDGPMLPPGNDNACWFCLGIGVLPVLDLEGFLLAHVPPLFRTADSATIGHSPFRPHLYLGKFPGARCQFAVSHLPRETKLQVFTSSPGPSPSLDDHELDETPDSLLATQLLSQLYGVQGRQDLRASSKPELQNSKSSRQMSGPQVAGGDMLGLGPLDSFMRQPGSRSSPYSEGMPLKGRPSTPTLADVVKSEGQVLRTLPGKPGAGQRQVSKEQKASGKSWKRGTFAGKGAVNGDASGRQLSGPGSSGTGEVASGAATLQRQSAWAGREDAETAQQSGSGGGWREGDSASSNSPAASLRWGQVGSPLSTRSPRRERNRIREKAEREALEKARRNKSATAGQNVVQSEDGTSSALQNPRPFPDSKWEQWIDGAKPSNKRPQNMWQVLLGKG